MSEERTRTSGIQAAFPRTCSPSSSAPPNRGRSVSDFVVAAAQEAAHTTIEETQIIRLSVEDQARICGSHPQSAPARVGHGARDRTLPPRDHRQSRRPGSFIFPATRRESLRTSFSCGVPGLDRHLPELAPMLPARQERSVASPRHGKIAGGHTFAAIILPLTRTSAQQAKRWPRYPSMSACLVGRPAVDQGIR